MGDRGAIFGTERRREKLGKRGDETRRRRKNIDGWRLGETWGGDGRGTRLPLCPRGLSTVTTGRREGCGWGRAEWIGTARVGSSFLDVTASGSRAAARCTTTVVLGWCVRLALRVRFSGGAALIAKGKQYTVAGLKT